MKKFMVAILIAGITGAGLVASPISDEKTKFYAQLRVFAERKPSTPWFRTEMGPAECTPTVLKEIYYTTLLERVFTFLPSNTVALFVSEQTANSPEAEQWEIFLRDVNSKHKNSRELLTSESLAQYKQDFTKCMVDHLAVRKDHENGIPFSCADIVVVMRKMAADEKMPKLENWDKSRK